MHDYIPDDLPPDEDTEEMPPREWWPPPPCIDFPDFDSFPKLPVDILDYLNSTST